MDKLKRAVEIFRSYVDALNGRNIEILKSLIQKKARFEFPYALPGNNKNLYGRESICDYLLKAGISFNYQERRIFEVSNPNLLVAELEVSEYYAHTSKACDQDVICVVSFKDDQIFTLTEYYNPLIRLEGLLDMERETS